jgi:hypothetical protein
VARKLPTAARTAAVRRGSMTEMNRVAARADEMIGAPPGSL